MCKIVRDNGPSLDAIFVQIFPAFINIPHVKWKSKKHPRGIGSAFHGAGKIRKNKKWVSVISGGYKPKNLSSEHVDKREAF